LTPITCIGMTFCAVKDNLSKSCTYKRGNKLIRQNQHIFRSIYIPKPTQKDKLSNKFQMKPGGDELHPLWCIVHHWPLHLPSPTSYQEFVYLWVMPSTCQEICVK
jgi:hypothetical protein